MTTLAPKLPWQHAFAGGYPRRGGQPLPTDPDAIDYLNRVAAADGAAVEVGIAQAIEAFIVGCKADSAGYAGDPTRSNWDAIKASCVMCGARTLSGALVPLKTPYGPELVNIDALPTPNIQNLDGSSGAWNAETRTISNTAQTASNTGFPRFQFAIPGIAVGKRYRVRVTVSGDSAAVSQIRLANTGGTPVPYSDNAVGERVFDGVVPATTANFVEFTINGNLPVPKSARIESFSIREDSFTPTPYNFASGDYSRSGATPGLKGNGSTKYLDTNRAGNADGQNDIHLSAYIAAAAPKPYLVSNYSYLGALDATFYSRLNQGSDTSIAVSNVTGFVGASRQSASTISTRLQQTTYADTKASITPGTASFLAYRNTTGSSYSDARLAFYSVGAAIDLAAMDERVTNLVTAIRFHTLTGLLPNDYDPATIAYITAAYAAGGTL